MKRLLWSLALVFLAACGGGPRVVDVRLPSVAPARDAAALAAAVEAFYVADGPEAMREAVAQAKAAGPEAAPYHEIAAELAELEDRRADRVAHLIAALMDPADDAAPMHLRSLADSRWTLEERARVEGVLAALTRDHAQPDVRAFAAWMLGHAKHARGDEAGRDAALATLGFWPKVAIIGTWDNDQGKGFDLEKPPERAIDLDARVAGKLVQVGWRTEFPMDPRGKIDLGSLMSPNRWQVAFAAAGVEADEAGDYELRIGTSDPIKVWLNDQEIFSGRRLDGWLFDGVVLPVKLRKGVNRVLIKSAQAKGNWLLTVRMTEAGGAPITDGRLRTVPADTAYAAGVKSPPVSLASVVERRVAGLPEGSARRLRHHVSWTRELGLRVATVELAERYVSRWEGSVLGRYLQAVSLWDNQERGRTADLLNTLDATFGDAMPAIALKQVRFWLQQKLQEKARGRLRTLVEAHPDRPTAYLALAQLLGAEKWNEDRCRLLAEANRRWPRWPRAMLAYASCQEALRLYPKAEAIYTELLEALPYDNRSLMELHWLAMGHDDYPVALAFAQRLTRAWPHLRLSWVRLAETHRRRGDEAGANAAIAKLQALAPESADAYARQARLMLQSGAVDAAVPVLKAALARDPENEGLANRLSYLAPEKAGPWQADVPSEADIDAAIAARQTVKPGEGTNIIYLLDDEVTALGADGSTINYVTLVAHAANQAGRDSLTRMKVRGGGRHRVLHAYAVDASGRRVEASSIRGRTVRFRQLAEGSTVVLQYRIDQRPDGYLASHMARQWWFQGPGVHTNKARWVLWTQPGTTLLEERLGPVQMTQVEKAGYVRTEWHRENVLPLLGEPAMPPMTEVASHVAVSTVPDWTTFWTWERALLRDAFRESPELADLAKRILEGAKTPQDKVERIQAYLMSDIRYQQDYEGHIAGVKPHAAPVVVARQYGDCKDKAVLFITLASLAGIDVHFALVRTRTVGQVRRNIPMQQFNHAIVYVPAQPGIAEGRFYDPTVDALDVDVLRHDDQGTWSVVFDPKAGTHRWRRIPFQAADVDDMLNDAVITLAEDGSATSDLTLVAKGRLGSLLRRGARNTQELGKMLEQLVGRTYPGARLLGVDPVQVTDVFQPARLQLAVESTSLGRREGDELRLKLPVGWSAQNYFTLSERAHPLVFGAPRQMRWHLAFNLPKGAKVARLPSSAELKSQCLHLKRDVQTLGGRVVMEQVVQVTCERLLPDAYAAERAKGLEMQRILDEELVVRLARSGRKGR